MNAQHSAKAFYLAQGYLPEGEVFMEAGIPHQKMTKQIVTELGR